MSDPTEDDVVAALCKLRGLAAPPLIHAKGDHQLATGPEDRDFEAALKAYGLEPADTPQAVVDDQPFKTALRVIAEGGEPRPIGKHWRTDGKPSKNDQCIHTRWLYEDCGQCTSEYAARTLEHWAPEDRR